MSDPDQALARRVKQHVVGKPHEFFAVVQPGFETIARAELAELGVEGIGDVVEGGVPFTSRLEGMVRANVGSRVVTRVLVRLAEFRADGFARLARRVAELPWELWLPAGAAVSLRVDSARSRLYHEGRVEEEARAAIATRLPDVRFEGGGQTVHVRLRDDRCALSLDTSGERLHRRGRRTFVGEASLRETIAAALLRAAGWPEDWDTLVDPMCGAGTFSLEAIEMAEGRLPGADREFAFHAWPAFRPAAYSHLVTKMAAAATARERRIVTSDADPDAVSTARANLPGREVVVRDFLADPPPPDGSRRLYVLNPPYGKRLGAAPRRIYRRIGEVLRADPDAGWVVIVPGLELEKVLSVPRDEKVLFRNGGLRVGALIRMPPPRESR